MTKSTITRERIELIANFHRAMALPPSHDEIEELARMALAAMDSEPVAWISQSNLDALSRGHDALVKSTDNVVQPVPLYRHAQPAPVVPDRSIFEQWWESQNGAPLDGWDSLRTTDGYCDDGIDGQLEACRAAMLAAAPHDTHALNSLQSVDSVADRWIPVSERMPPSRYEVLVGRWWGEKPRWCCKWATYIPGHPDSQSSGWLIPGASWTPTHWMPLPAAPQEVNHG